MRIKFKYYNFVGILKARISMIKFDVGHFIWFQQRAFNSLRGKEMIMANRIVECKSGYKYYQIEISLCPLSKTETINKRKD